MIELVGVNKTFTTKDLNVEACKDVNLKIEDGDIFGIIGFSGAGKSTLVRCINLLERPTSGKVLIDGVDITQLKEAELRKIRKKIGMIFQHFNDAFAHGLSEYRLSVKRKQADQSAD